MVFIGPIEAQIILRMFLYLRAPDKKKELC